MGTKANPGRFDCHARAEEDEPLFSLLARDPLAPFLVSIWSSQRYGDSEAANVKFAAMLQRAALRYGAEPDIEKASEALDCAMAMFAWRKQHHPADRASPPAHGSVRPSPDEGTPDDEPVPPLCEIPTPPRARAGLAA